MAARNADWSHYLAYDPVGPLTGKGNTNGVWSWFSALDFRHPIAYHTLARPLYASLILLRARFVFPENIGMRTTDLG